MKPFRDSESGSPSRPRPLIVVALGQVTMPLLGAAVGGVILVCVLIPRLGLGDVERIIQLGYHLDQTRSGSPYAVFLGDSVTMEGIDAAIVQSAARTDWKVENLAVSGCGVNEQRILLPKVLNTGPAAVVLSFGPMNLAVTDDLPPDKAYAYAMAGFPESWPTRYSREDFPGLSRPSYDALFSTALQQRLHFRTAPLNWINNRLRLSLRSDLRGGTDANWTAPYQMLRPVSREVLAWHMDALRQAMESAGEQGREDGATNLRRLIAAVSESGATPLLVIRPVHPQLRQSAAPLLRPLKGRLVKWADTFQGVVVDASTALPEDQFADAVHPNAVGRETYSRLMGAHLPAAPRSAGAADVTIASFRPHRAH